MACPMCAKDTDAAYRPFCSKRCADLDLAKWLGGSYAIASQNEDDFDELDQELEKAPSEGEDDPDLPRPS
jgi:endogenous inhibitor of DNA gyrase (YacG/DUF329 family)